MSRKAYPKTPSHIVAGQREGALKSPLPGGGFKWGLNYKI